MSLIGCQTSHPKKEKTLYLNLKQNPSTLDPRCARNLIDITLLTQLFEGLMRLDQKGNPVCAAAKEISISEDCLQYTFALRESHWSDGSKVTAYDFEYAWKKVLDPQFLTDYAQMLYVIKNGKDAKMKKCSLDEIGIKVIDENTLEVTLERPTPYFLSLTTFPVMFPIKKDLDETDPQWMFTENRSLYNGPFIISHWKNHYALTLKKNPRYWDKNQVSLESIDFSIVSDPATESYLFEKDELDWIGHPLSREINAEFLQKLKKENKISAYDVLGTYMIKFHTEKEPFNDPNIRKAFSYSAPRNKIITHILQGDQKIATSFLPPGLKVKDTPYFTDENISEAKALFENFLQEKNLTREKFPKVVISYGLSERNLKIVQLLQEMWQKTFGIKIELNGMEMQCFRQQLKSGNFLLAMGDWIADFKDPLSFLEIFQYKPDDKCSGLNETRWKNMYYNEFLEKASCEKDINLRNQYFQEAETILMNEMPIAPLYHYSFEYSKKDRINNVILSSLGIADFKYVDIAK